MTTPAPPTPPAGFRRAGRFLIDYATILHQQAGVLFLQSVVLILEARGVPLRTGTGWANLYLGVCDLFDEYDGPLDAAPLYSPRLLHGEKVREAVAAGGKVLQVGEWGLEMVPHAPSAKIIQLNG